MEYVIYDMQCRVFNTEKVFKSRIEALTHIANILYTNLENGDTDINFEDLTVDSIVALYEYKIVELSFFLNGIYNDLNSLKEHNPDSWERELMEIITQYNKSVITTAEKKDYEELSLEVSNILKEF